MVLLNLILLDSIKIVGNGFTNKWGKCRGGGGKYASVAIVIKHKKAASVGLLRVSQQLTGQSLCWLVIPPDDSRSCRKALFPAANLVGTGPKDLCEPEHRTQFGGITLLVHILSFRDNFDIKLGKTVGEKPKRCLTTFSRGRESKASLYWLSSDYYSFVFVLILQRLKV